MRVRTSALDRERRVSRLQIFKSFINSEQLTSGERRGQSNLSELNEDVDFVNINVRVRCNSILIDKAT